MNVNKIYIGMDLVCYKKLNWSDPPAIGERVRLKEILGGGTIVVEFPYSKYHRWPAAASITDFRPVFEKKKLLKVKLP